jgi:hypothetical protein
MQYEKKQPPVSRKAAVMLYNLRKQSAPSWMDVFLGAFNCIDHFHFGPQSSVKNN